MNRREFIGSFLFAALGLALPIELSSTLTIVDVRLLESFRKTIKVDPKIIDGQAIADVSFSQAEMWEHVRLIDSDDRHWRTDDQGKTWWCGKMSFSTEHANQE